MEDLLLTYPEHQILQKHKKKLESRYQVKLNMPVVKSSDSWGSEEIIFVSIVGNNQNINNVKKFLKRKLEATTVTEMQENNTSVIILDNDSDDENILSNNNVNKPRRKKARTEIQEVDIIPPSFSSDPCVSKNVSFSNNPLEESVIIIDPTPSAEDFIPLSSGLKRKAPSLKTPSSIDNDIICLSSDEEDSSDLLQKMPLPITRRLRPVVIDGSNVARAHGKPSNTFSCKGIKLSVEYFLKRGHPQVTVFVPLFRRHYKNGKVPTTDEHILDELEKNQNLVYTPSRRLNGKLISSYDDRFIVKLATEIGGVILSNDNYKDIVGESEDYREVIEKRLVMFCFAGDIFMIPSDPLGNLGPSIEEVLSFPPE